MASTRCRSWRVAAQGCRCAARRRGRWPPPLRGSTWTGCCGGRERRKGRFRRVRRLHEDAREKGSHASPLPSPSRRKPPDSESLLARGCSLVKRLWLGTHVLSAKGEHLGVVGGDRVVLQCSGAAVRSKWVGCVKAKFIHCLPRIQNTEK